MTRSRDLLLAAARALEDGRSPLDHAFLVEHDVTLNEASDLADLLATGAHLMLQISDDIHSSGTRRSDGLNHMARLAITRVQAETPR